MKDKKVLDILDLAGSVKTPKGKSKDILATRKYMQTHYERV